MDLDRSGMSADEYYVTALQIFHYCGAESTSTLRVDSLMDKFAPFVKTNKAEFSFLKSFMDPDDENPEIDVSMLAKTLHKYTENQKSKADMDESFNLKSGAPQDSDSGISTDGSQLLEDLQCELREKAHLAHQLRSQLDFTDRQHEEALAALTAERDALRTHLNMLREENASLSQARQDYEEASERLCTSERSLEETRRELDAVKRRSKVMLEQLNTLENEKLTLQELLTKSKAECHRINEMYAARQSALLEQNETLRSEHADLAARLQDQDEFVQQMIKEKVLLEMELKDVLNKSNQTQLRLDRSIDISYTEEQMLTALDSLNADTRFSSENRILDEESFINALKEDQGRCTNMSLFDEIRYSFCNMSKHNNTGSNSISYDKNFDFNMTIGTQTDETKPYDCADKVESTGMGTQTEEVVSNNNNNNVQIQCLECVKMSRYTEKLELDVNRSHSALSEMQVEIENYEGNLDMLEQFVKEGNERNNVLQAIIKSLEMKISLLEVACDKQRDRLASLSPDCCVHTQTQSDTESVATQVDVPCIECEKRNAVVPHRSLRKFFWESLKCLFQLFAVVCFVCAVWALSGVSRGPPACPRRALPWRWLQPQDIMDLLLRIEYVADVPM
ncbi:unnamed protein product [Spodoptera littoralis]|uniref:Uncharacterized protein n=1 Tax=Spodoptera littoralis TaxID=7109 RepID=A0A9P0I3Q1_SPOLI|nr:unnamed protein product [Spodoptera littoralis]CAH1638370.1 unnamed protein product [Spodoptera littoralis]